MVKTSSGLRVSLARFITTADVEAWAYADGPLNGFSYLDDAELNDGSNGRVVGDIRLQHCRVRHKRREEVFCSGKRVMTHDHVGRQRSRLRRFHTSFDRQGNESRVCPQPRQRHRMCVRR
jgi:hypothetical protein